MTINVVDKPVNPFAESVSHAAMAGPSLYLVKEATFAPAAAIPLDFMHGVSSASTEYYLVGDPVELQSALIILGLEGKFSLRPIRFDPHAADPLSHDPSSPGGLLRAGLGVRADEVLTMPPAREFGPGPQPVDPPVEEERL